MSEIPTGDTEDDLEFDQTNGAVDLGGDDGGADDLGEPDGPSLIDVLNVERLLDDDPESGATDEDLDPAVGGYSEEGVL